MKHLFLYVGLIMLFFFSETGAQSYIGLEKDDVRSLARKSGFYSDHITTSQSFNYLKFVNSADTKTLIVFFSDENISTHTRVVCDYSEYDFIRANYDSNYRKKGNNKWEFNEGINKYVVTLEEKEWYFVLNVKKK